jgi:hypothetical protein
MRLFNTALASASVASERTGRLYSLNLDAVSYSKTIIRVLFFAERFDDTYIRVIDACVQTGNRLW